jgi:hypothetical protein
MSGRAIERSLCPVKERAGLRGRWAQVTACALALASTGASADELPVSLQAQLLQKTATYVTSLQPGESGTVKVLVLFTGATPSHATEALVASLNQDGQVGKYKAEAKLVPISSLKASLAAEKPQVLWVPADLDEKAVDQVIEACGQSPIVTVSSVAAHVKRGIILGFDAVEAKPRILVHLKQARAQNVVFLSGLLTHSVIVER